MNRSNRKSTWTEAQDAVVKLGAMYSISHYTLAELLYPSRNYNTLVMRRYYLKKAGKLDSRKLNEEELLSKVSLLGTSVHTKMLECIQEAKKVAEHVLGTNTVEEFCLSKHDDLGTVTTGGVSRTLAVRRSPATQWLPVEEAVLLVCLVHKIPRETICTILKRTNRSCEGKITNLKRSGFVYLESYEEYRKIKAKVAVSSDIVACLKKCLDDAKTCHAVNALADCGIAIIA